MKSFPIALFIATGSLVAQTQFEVATVKPTQPTPAGIRGCAPAFKVTGNRADITCSSLQQLIAYAFRTTPDLINSPNWLTKETQQFDIAATIPAGAPSSQMAGMLQALLGERFKLTTHREMKERPVYALVAMRGTPDLKEATSNAPGQNDMAGDANVFLTGSILVTTIRDPNGLSTIITSSEQMGIVRETQGPNRARHWEAPATTMQGLAELLDEATPLTLPVIDMTGLQGRYQITLEVAGDVSSRVMEAAAKGGPEALRNVLADLDEAFFNAYNVGLRKLGLQLDRRKGMVQTITVDQVERMPGEN